MASECDTSWVTKFKIPWHKIPQSILKTIWTGNRPPKEDIATMLDALISAIKEVKNEATPEDADYIGSMIMSSFRPYVENEGVSDDEFMYGSPAKLDEEDFNDLFSFKTPSSKIKRQEDEEDEEWKVIASPSHKKRQRKSKYEGMMLVFVKNINCLFLTLYTYSSK